MGAQAWPFNYATTGDPAYTARQLRQLSVAPFVAMGSSGRPLGAKSGIRVGTPSSVATITGSGPYSWNIGGFAGVIDGEANAAAGPYAYSFDTTQTGTIAAAGAAARVDAVDVVISDSDEGDGSGAKNVTCMYTEGPATGGGTPAAPARSHRLFLINVPTSGAPTIQWAPDWSGDPGEWTFNTVAERDAYVALIGSANVPPMQKTTVLADVTAQNSTTYTWYSTGWSDPRPKTRLVPATASGALGSGLTVALFGTQTIPAAPFGPGVPYTLRVRAYAAAAPSSGALGLTVQVDGANVPVSQSNNSAGSAAGVADITSTVIGEQQIASPNSTHTVSVILAANGSALTIRANGNGQNIAGAVIELLPLVSF